MKLIGLSIENLRKIKAARFDFDGKHLVQIRGENGAGKSTVLDAIKFLFSGAKDIPDDVVTHGQEKAKIIGQIDEYMIKRVITGDGKSTITVENKAGKISSPQAFLDTVSGQFLDPEWFSNLPGIEKKKTVMNYLGIDFTVIDTEIANTEQSRLQAGRELKAIGDPVPVEKVEAKSIQELIGKRSEIILFNEKQDIKLNEIRKGLNELRQSMIDILTDGFNTVTDFELFENDLKNISEIYKNEYPKIKELPRPEPIRSTEEVEKEITSLEENNRKAQAYQEYLKKREVRDAKQKEHDALDEKVKALRQQKLDMVDKTELPIKGLTIGEEGLLLNGVTDENWAQSESLKVSLLLALAFSGELKTVYIKRGESMDSKSLAKLKELAEVQDFQIIMEIVDDSYTSPGDGIIYIEEGEIIPKKEK